MPLETLVVYVADCKLRSPPINFKYASAAAVMLLGATVLLLRGVAGGPASAPVPIAWVLSSRPCSGLLFCANAPRKGDLPIVGTFCPGGASGELKPDLGDDIRG
jgi:hypothetical protein